VHVVVRSCLAITLLTTPGFLTATASAQTPTDTAIRADLAGIRTALEQMVPMLKELVNQNTKQTRINALTQRLDVAMKRLQMREDELRQARDRKAKEETDLTNLKGSLDALAEMAKQDTTGSAREAIDNERARLQAGISQKTPIVQQLTSEVAALEADVAAKRQAVDEIERTLDRELGVVK
jgi:predicted  nucleic acid-binding Zn-ribbon protein